MSADPSELSFGVEPSNSISGSSGVSNPQNYSCLKKLPESKSRQLEQAADNLIPEAFEALVSYGRLRLLEVACSPNSLLSGTMMELTKDSSAAERCSLFNDCDLRTNQGIHKIIQTIDCQNPEMVWLSPICGPYSVMQNVNQRNPQQCEELQAKRRDALKQYVGCCIVFSYCVQRGIHVAWEWSQSCQAWRLPIIQKLIQKYEPLFSIVRGCRVGLVTDKGDPISKGWKIMTTHPLLHKRLELPCVCKKGTVHVKCEGSLTRKTELYTKTFATRVCKAILQGSDSRAIRDELQGKPQIHETFGEGVCCVCSLGEQHDAKLQCGSCVHSSYKKLLDGSEKYQPQVETPKSRDVLVAEGDNPEGQPLVEQQDDRQVGLVPHREKIRKQLYLLHAATGHSPTKYMVLALQRRGASQDVLDEARKFECTVCKEKQRAIPRHLASLEPHPPKWSTIAADFGDWTHPHSGHKFQFVLFIDEGSRFRVGRMVLEGSKPHVNSPLFLSTFRDAWIQYFGHPQTLRVDPDGTFRSAMVQDFCDRHRIHLDIIPGEAHWKLGICEQAIGGVKHLMDKLAEDDPEISASDALSEATRAFNHREIIRGYSPVQHALGRAPDELGRFFSSLGPDAGACPDLLVENGTGEMQRNLQRMQVAEKSFLDWEAKQRISRAQNSRAQTVRTYRPGDLVYIWRKQVSGAAASKHGRFIGPARVLAVERRQHPDGLGQEGGSVWCVRGRRLVKCCQEQLRPATSKETLLHELTMDHHDDWDFQRVAQELGGNEFEDVSMDTPDLPEWLRAQDPRHEWQPLSRCRTKRSAREAELPTSTELAPPNPVDLDLDIFDEEPEGPGASSSSRGARRTTTAEVDGEPTTRARSRSRHRSEPGSGFVAGTPWYSFAAVVEASSPTPVAFWCQEGAAVSVEVEMPDTKASSERALRDLQAYIAGNLKKRSAVEVYEKNLSPTELEEFRSAKAVEVNNFLASRAFQALPDHLRPHHSQAVRMRWVLTWKYRDDGSRKAKARAVLLGYQDPLYENRATTSPTTTRQTRQLQMVLSASLGFSMKKGDVTGAFLQSRPYPGELFCIPCKEICAGMGIPENSITKVQKACYGLVDAPLEWYRSICTFFETLGLKRCWSDPCCWILQRGDRIHGIISGHVDDFLFSGSEQDALWKKVTEAIKAEYKWSDWEHSQFVQCGVLVEQHQDHSFSLSQAKYVDDLKYINLRSHRKKDRSAETDDWEKTQLRALLGGLSWHAQQVAPHFSAEVGLLLSEVTKSTIDTICRANHLLDQVKEKRDHRLLIKSIPLSELSLFAWVDAATQNRIDGSSTQGIIIGVSSNALLTGSCEHVAFIAWHSQKIDRKCRSPGAAEALAAINGEDCLYYARFQMSEMMGFPVDVRNCNETVNKVPGTLVTDSRNVFDKMETEVLSIRGAEKRTDIELIALKDSQLRNKVNIRWVHGEAQLANGLTKTKEFQQLNLFYKMQQRWRIVEDPERASARRRKSAGLTPLEDRPPSSLSRDSKTSSSSSSAILSSPPKDVLGDDDLGS